MLETQPFWQAQEGVRLPCSQLLPVAADATARLQRVLDTAARRASARVDRTMAYAEGRRCRHADLAAHLGERLPPCGDACDVCTGEGGQTVRADTGSTRAAPARKRTEATAADALVVLQALASAPFSVGKTGLIRLLEGSIQSRIQEDRSPWFGSLADLQKAKIDALIDRLVEDGFLLRDLGHEFKLIRLTPQGAAATADELAVYDMRPRPSAPTGAAAAPDAESTLSAEDETILQHLQDWRRERAARDGVAAFIVAHNATLEAIAQTRPTSLDALIAIKGFGETRAEKYGTEILAAIEGAGAAGTLD